MPYEVKIDELQVLEAIAELSDANGNSLGYEHRSNLFLNGEVIADAQVSPVIREALEAQDEDDPTYRHLRGKLEYVSDARASLNVAQRLGLPFPDYESLSEEEVVNAMRVLPGAVVQAIKEYEASNDRREAILTYNAGTREGLRDRIEGKLSSDRDDSQEGPTARFKTREVSESDADPAEVEPGVAKDAPQEDAVEAPKPRGRGRRQQPQQDNEGTENPS